MSGYKPVGVEVLFSTYQAATISVPTAAPVTITAGWPAIIIPAGYFSDTGDWSSSLRFRMGGFMTATATVPTFSWGLAVGRVGRELHSRHPRGGQQPRLRGERPARPGWLG